jgi:hypothetical protein
VEKDEKKPVAICFEWQAGWAWQCQSINFESILNFGDFVGRDTELVSALLRAHDMSK